MKKIIRTLLLSLLPSLGAVAQDIHFSQFYMSPLNLNPAMTGVIGCDMRFSGTYRNQWASILRSNAFKTYNASFDMRLPVGRSDYVGIGTNIWADKAGSAGLATQQFNLSGSYLKKLGGYRSKESYLTAGAQIGVTNRSIDANKLIYGDQWDGGSGYTPVTQEVSFDPNFLFADVSAGALWFGALNRENTSNVYAGVAFHHLNRANMSFKKQKFEALYSKFVVHGGGEFALNKKTSLLPGVLFFKQGPSFEANFGTSVKFKFNKIRSSRQAFHLGLWMRLAGHYENAFLSDAAIISTRFDYEDFSLGLSYDVNVSSLRAATNYNGAFEIALNYKICNNKKRNLGCPDF